MAQELQPRDPRKVGPYWLLGRLGAGGMGQVFLGRSPGGRLVAVKVVRAELAGQAEFRTRFAREAAAAQKVSGLFTAPVVDADVDAPVPWLATAYVPGLSLADAITGHGPLPAVSVLALVHHIRPPRRAGQRHRTTRASLALMAVAGPGGRDNRGNRPGSHGCLLDRRRLRGPGAGAVARTGRPACVFKQCVYWGNRTSIRGLPTELADQ
jgi:hypothetical protein